MNITENKLAAHLIITSTIRKIEKSLAGVPFQKECAEWGITADQWVSQNQRALAELKYAENQ